MLDKLPTGVQRGEALLRLRLFSQDWGTKRGLTQDSWGGLWHPSWIPAFAGMMQCGACRGAKPSCFIHHSPFAKGGHRGIGPGDGAEAGRDHLDSCFGRNDTVITPFLLDTRR